MTQIALVKSSTGPVTVVGVMLALAALDFIGALFAKEWTINKSPWMFLAGAVSFVVLYVVYAYGLHVAELSTITFGWIVGLQVGILLVERFRYGVTLSPAKWTAVVAILALQAFLVLGDGGSASEDVAALN